MSESTRWISLAEAAQKLETTGLNVLMRVKRGQLVGTEVHGSWVIDAASLDACHRSHQSPVVTPSCGGCQTGCR
ncbi:MAG: hypothetical protein GWO11_07120 [Desulfuromonadales bacterium]|nr:hypothetical protein [Desulfuromonadales bacterium]NIR34108.1 hypothetical protein [Desulfuromonadales bacterium]NIS41564.1 hypothetical protein [Desulfuromonadales bacterium]